MNLPHTPLEQALIIDVPAISRVVDASVRHPNHRKSVHEQLSETVADCIGAWRMRAFIPITSIVVSDGQYTHPADDLTRPAFPNGYPVIIISFNGSHVGMIGVRSRPDRQYTVTVAELTASKLMLEGVQ